MTNKRRQKKKKKNFQIPNECISLVAILATAIACFYGVSVTKNTGTAGNGYFSIGFGLFFVFCIFAGIGLNHAVNVLVTMRLERRNASAARKVIRIALGMAIAGSVICWGVGLGLSDMFTKAVSGSEYAALALKSLLPAMLPITVSSVLTGGLDGFGNDRATSYVKATFCLTFIFSSGHFMKSFYEYGEKVSALLQNDQYAPAYGAMGAGSALTIASMAGLIAAAICWYFYRIEIKERVQLEAGDTENGLQIQKSILNQAMLILIPAFFAAIAFLGQMILFFHACTKENSKASASDFGLYTGTVCVWFVFPLLCAFLFAVHMLPELKIGFIKRNLKRSRDKCMLSLRCSALLTMPFAVILAMLAEPLTKGFLEESFTETTVGLLRTGSISLVFFGLAFVVGMVLVSVDMLRSIALDLLASVAVFLISLYVMLNPLNMGISALPCANLLFGIVLCFTFLSSVTRKLRMKINWIRVLLAPIAGGLIMAVISGIFGHIALKALPQSVNLVVSSIVGLLFYVISVLALKGVSQRELRAYPGGEVLVMVAKTLRLM